MEPPQDNMPADGWHLGKHDAHYLTRDGVSVAVVYQRADGWFWWGFEKRFLTTPGRNGPHSSKEAAQKAAEAANPLLGVKSEGE